MSGTNGHAPRIAPPSDRLPPANLDAERGVLGTVLLDPGTLDDVAGVLDPEHFWREDHAILYRAIRELYDLGATVDMIAVAEELQRRGHYERIGGDDLMAECVESVPHAANAAYYAQIVRQKATVRGVIAACDELSRLAYSNTLSADALLAKAEAKVFDLTAGSDHAELRPVGEHAARAMARIESRQGGTLSGVPSGFAGLDAITDGFQPRNLILLAARTAVGKSACALNIADHAAVERGLAVLYVSMEMGGDEHAERLLASRARVDAHKLKTGMGLTDHERADLGRAFAELSACERFQVDDSPVRTLSQVAANARRMRKRIGLDLLIVDYLQLVDSVSELGGRASREERVSHVSRRLKALAGYLDVPVIALSQLNRESAKRDGGTPRISDLRESGALEQDANMVLLLHRPEMVDADDRPGYAELVVAKHRGGRTGTVKLAFRHPHLRFEDWVGPDPAPPQQGSDHDDDPDF